MLKETFTRSEVVAIIQKVREPLRNRIANLKTASDPKLVELMRKQIDDLSGRLEEDHSARQASEQERLLADRDSKIKAYLESAGAKDVEVAFRFLLHDLKRDEAGNWCLPASSGELVSITEESVRSHLPDSLRKPVLNGGSGSAAATTRDDRNSSELKREKAKLEELRTKARRTASSFDLVQYSKQRQLVEQLERRK